jgi:hypothetical protein
MLQYIYLSNYYVLIKEFRKQENIEIDFCLTYFYEFSIIHHLDNQEYTILQQKENWQRIALYLDFVEYPL